MLLDVGSYEYICSGFSMFDFVWFNELVMDVERCCLTVMHVVSFCSMLPMFVRSRLILVYVV